MQCMWMRYDIFCCIHRGRIIFSNTILLSSAFFFDQKIMQARFLESHMTLPQATPDKSSNNELAQPLIVGGSSGVRSGAAAACLTFPPPSLSFMCVLTFLEAIGLYGLIVALIIVS